MDLYAQTDYRDVIREHLAKGQAERPGLSLRAFARDLGLTASRLSEVLSGKHGLSRLTASAVAKRLQLSIKESEHFCDLVESLDARSEAARDGARERIKEREKVRPSFHLRDDIFSLVSDWYHLAILELSGTVGFKSDPAWIGKILGVTAHQVEMALQRLTRLGLISRSTDKIVPVRAHTVTTDEVPSEAIRYFQAQILQKARQALFSQGVDRREIGSMVMSIRHADLPEAKAMLKEFRRKFCKTVEAGAESRDEVYCLTTAFFSLHGAEKDPTAGVCPPKQ